MKEEHFSALFDQMIDENGYRNNANKHPAMGVIKNRVLSKLKKLSHADCILSSFGDCNEIINAHSIQNNRILDKLSVNGKLIWWDNHSLADDNIEGRNKATTFKGFCKKHDEIFNPIEHKEYIVGDKEQEFLFVYRAFAKEYNFIYETQKFLEWYDEELKEDSTAIELYQNVMMKNRASIEPGRADRQEIGRLRNKIRLADINKSIQKFEHMKAGLTANLSQGKYNKIETHVFESNASNSIACSSMPYIMTDLEGNPFNRQLNIPAFLTVVPQGNKTFILFSYFKKNKYYFEKLVKQIEAHSVEEIEVIFSNIIMKYCQNSVFSPDKFDNFNEKTMREIEWITSRRTQYPNEKLVISKINLFS